MSTKLYEIAKDVDQEELFDTIKQGLTDYGWKVTKRDNGFFVEIPTDEDPLELAFSTVFELNAFSAGIGIGLMMNESCEDCDEDCDCEFELED